MAEFDVQIDPAAEHFRTAIIATLGPASSQADVINQLMEAGVTIFRLNFSHGDEASHEQTLRTIREVEQQRQEPVAVLGDLPGPKIRLTEVPGDGMDLSAGHRVIFHRGCASATTSGDGKTVCVGCTWDDMIQCVSPGHRVLIDDGMVRLHALEQVDDTLVCEVDTPGRIRSHKGVNLPDSDLDIEMPTERDRRFATWAIEHELDWVAMSFVRNADDVRALDAHMRSCTGSSERPLPIVAKMEVPKAIEHAKTIAQEVDAMMVARGDLGVEMDLALVPSIQKHLLAVTRDARKPCIVATQMLQSMIESPVPTRAEASDVATAIFDGADAVMLSGETAVGQYPVEAVSTMHRISRITETTMRRLSLSTGCDLEPMVTGSCGAHRALVQGAWRVARMMKARCIVVPSNRGVHAQALSRNDFQLPVLALAEDCKTIRRMLLYRGVTPVQVEPMPIGRDLVYRAEQEVTARGWAEPGQHVVVLSSEPVDGAGVKIIVHCIGEEAED